MRCSQRMRLALSSLLLGACGGGAVESLGHPPVVLVLFDALHACHVTHLGYERETTPALDALARDGTSFRNAFAPAPFTLASVPSLLTGRLPEHHGLTNKIAVLPEAEETLAELLSAAGWWCAGAVANLNGSSAFDLDQGFDVYRELFQVEPGGEVEHTDFAGREFRIPRAGDFPQVAEEFLSQAPEGQPPFLYLHVLQPHAPYLVREEFRSLWLEPGYEGPFAGGETQPLVDSNREPESKGYLPVTSEDMEASRALYDANLREADDALSQIVAALRAADLYEESLIIVTSDHGEAFWEHGRWGHNDHLYDEMLHVPLVVKLPEGRGVSGAVREELVSLLDVVPSLCEWLDLGVPREPMDGYSLAGLLEGQGSEGPGGPGRELILRSHHKIPSVGLRTERTKTIVQRDQKGGHAVSIEHFDLEKDPMELEDLYLGRRSEVQPEARRLEEWIRHASVNLNTRGVPLTLMQERMLKALGYGGEADPGEGSEPGAQGGAAARERGQRE